MYGDSNGLGDDMMVVVMYLDTRKMGEEVLFVARVASVGNGDCFGRTIDRYYCKAVAAGMVVWCGMVQRTTQPLPLPLFWPELYSLHYYRHNPTVDYVWYHKI
jgi:hypothetical protein